MARPLRIEYEGAFYHVIQRGIERRNIFISDEDKEKLLHYFSLAYAAYNIVFHTYVLMNNHYHIILETPHSNLSKAMHYINTAYAAYLNSKHKRAGPLYQGRFKAILVQQDEYLHHLSRYIHLNPVRAGIVKSPIEYRWSSYRYFISDQKPPVWLNIKFILSMFDNKSTSKAKSLYKQFMLNDTEKEEGIIKQNTRKGIILGDRGFFNSIRVRFIRKEEDSEIPILKELKSMNEPTLEYIEDIVMEDISNNNRLRRKLAIYLSRKYTQKTLNEIADFYGKIKYPGVSKIFKRTEDGRRSDKELNNMLLKLEKKINV